MNRNTETCSMEKKEKEETPLIYETQFLLNNFLISHSIDR